MDTQGLKENFAQVAEYGDAVALFFYSDLFLRAPEVRDLFPVSMARQRDRLLNALGRIVSQVDDLEELTPFIKQLGKDHRKFGIEPGFYPAVGASLLATLAHFSGPSWSHQLATDWGAAYQLVARVMIDAAEEDAATHPPYWVGTVLSHELRAPDIAVIRVAPEPRLGYLPGQAVAVHCVHRPRLWRFYSIANLPRADNTVDLHVRLIPGGPVSMAMVRNVTVGEKLMLGAPVGDFALDTESPRDILMVAGSTGLAPLKAMIEEIAQRPTPPRVDLFFGARTSERLYDLPDLEKFADQHDWLTVTPAVSHDSTYAGERGLLPDVVARYGRWTQHDAYVCGPPRMVGATVARLSQLGVPTPQIRVDAFGETVGEA